MKSTRKVLSTPPANSTGPAGNGNGTDLRWTDTWTIQGIVLKAYAVVHHNLLRHDSLYPTAEELLSIVRVDNIDFEGEWILTPRDPSLSAYCFSTRILDHYTYKL